MATLRDRLQKTTVSFSLLYSLELRAVSRTQIEIPHPLISWEVVCRYKLIGKLAATSTETGTSANLTRNFYEDCPWQLQHGLSTRPSRP